MKRNPNAVAALFSTQAAVALEALIQRYLSAGLGPFWGKEAMAAAVIVVLYVGRHGIKAAFAKVVETTKAVWAPPAPPK